jgi:hypothetical protein
VLFGTADRLRGVPPDPTAWQVYSMADVELAVLAGGLVAAGLYGSRRWRLVAFAGAFAGFAFVLGALVSPPQTALGRLFDPSNSVPRYLDASPGAGVGETVALLGLLLSIAGLGTGLLQTAAGEANHAIPSASAGEGVINLR